MLFNNNKFGQMNSVLNQSPFVQNYQFAKDPIPPPPSRAAMLTTLDGNMIITSDGNGIFLNNVDG